MEGGSEISLGRITRSRGVLVSRDAVRLITGEVPDGNLPYRRGTVGDL